MKTRPGCRAMVSSSSNSVAVNSTSRPPTVVCIRLASSFRSSPTTTTSAGVAVESYERAIDAHVKNIRRKIEPEPHSPRYLRTVFGVGYRVADPG